MNVGHYVTKRIRDKLFRCDDANHQQSRFNPSSILLSLYQKTKQSLHQKSFKKLAKE